MELSPLRSDATNSSLEQLISSGLVSPDAESGVVSGDGESLPDYNPDMTKAFLDKESLVYKSAKDILDLCLHEKQTITVINILTKSVTSAGQKKEAAIQEKEISKRNRATYFLAMQDSFHRQHVPQKTIQEFWRLLAPLIGESAQGINDSIMELNMELSLENYLQSRAVNFQLISNSLSKNKKLFFLFKNISSQPLLNLSIEQLNNWLGETPKHSFEECLDILVYFKQLQCQCWQQGGMNNTLKAKNKAFDQALKQLKAELLNDDTSQQQNLTSEQNAQEQTAGPLPSSLSSRPPLDFSALPSPESIIMTDGMYKAINDILPDAPTNDSTPSTLNSANLHPLENHQTDSHNSMTNNSAQQMCTQQSTSIPAGTRNSQQGNGRKRSSELKITQFQGPEIQKRKKSTTKPTPHLSSQAVNADPTVIHSNRSNEQNAPMAIVNNGNQWLSSPTNGGVAHSTNIQQLSSNQTALSHSTQTNNQMLISGASNNDSSLGSHDRTVKTNPHLEDSVRPPTIGSNTQGTEIISNTVHPTGTEASASNHNAHKQNLDSDVKTPPPSPTRSADIDPGVTDSNQRHSPMQIDQPVTYVHTIAEPLKNTKKKEMHQEKAPLYFDLLPPQLQQKMLLANCVPAPIMLSVIWNRIVKNNEKQQQIERCEKESTVLSNKTSDGYGSSTEAGLFGNSEDEQRAAELDLITSDRTNFPVLELLVSSSENPIHDAKATLFFSGIDLRGGFESGNSTIYLIDENTKHVWNVRLSSRPAKNSPLGVNSSEFKEIQTVCPFLNMIYHTVPPIDEPVRKMLQSESISIWQLPTTEEILLKNRDAKQCCSRCNTQFSCRRQEAILSLFRSGKNTPKTEPESCYQGFVCPEDPENHRYCRYHILWHCLHILFDSNRDYYYPLRCPGTINDSIPFSYVSTIPCSCTYVFPYLYVRQLIETMTDKEISHLSEEVGLSYYFSIQDKRNAFLQRLESAKLTTSRLQEFAARRENQRIDLELSLVNQRKIFETSLAEYVANRYEECMNCRRCPTCDAPCKTKDLPFVSVIVPSNTAYSGQNLVSLVVFNCRCAIPWCFLCQKVASSFSEHLDSRQSCWKYHHCDGCPILATKAFVNQKIRDQTAEVFLALVGRIRHGKQKWSTVLLASTVEFRNAWQGWLQAEIRERSARLSREDSV